MEARRKWESDRDLAKRAYSEWMKNNEEEEEEEEERISKKRKEIIETRNTLIIKKYHIVRGDICQGRIR